MNKSEVKSYIIRNFLERNYNIYISLIDESFCLQRDSIVGTAIILNTTTASDGRILLDLRNKKNSRKTLPYTHYTYVIGFDIDTRDIWLVPVDDIADNRTLTMSAAKDCYLLLRRNDTTEPTVVNTALKEKILKTIVKVATTEDAKTQRTKDREVIDNMLNIRK